MTTLITSAITFLLGLFIGIWLRGFSIAVDRGSEFQDDIDKWQKEVEKEKRAWINNERCHVCGEKKDMNSLSDMCDNCLETE